MAPGSPHLPLDSAQSCSLARYLQRFSRETGWCHDYTIQRFSLQAVCVRRSWEKKAVAMEKEKNPFQLVGLAFASHPYLGEGYGHSVKPQLRH